VALADFHLHSTASDGVHPPAWVARTAAANGVRTFALTDHDTTEGLAEARAEAGRLGLHLVTGIELSTDLGKADVHLLGFGFDAASKRLQEYLAWLRESRIGRAGNIVAALADMGAPIALERVFAIAGEASVGRPHVARALVEAGHVATVQEAFDRYLANGGPADIPRAKLTPAQAIAEVHAAGGVVFAAHPLFIGEDWEAALREFTSLGLDGVETFYKHYAPETVEAVGHAASRLGLAMSGGSDFHGLGNQDDRAIGDIPFHDAEVARFLDFLDDHGIDTGAPRHARS
jgi:hypothetical protein